MSGLNADKTERSNAVIEAKRARESLEKAARHLGFENAQELSLEAPELGLGGGDAEAVKAITNAHQHLDNGMVSKLADVDE